MTKNQPVLVTNFLVRNVLVTNVLVTNVLVSNVLVTNVLVTNVRPPGRIIRILHNIGFGTERERDATIYIIFKMRDCRLNKNVSIFFYLSSLYFLFIAFDFPPIYVILENVIVHLYIFCSFLSLFFCVDLIPYYYGKKATKMYGYNERIHFHPLKIKPLKDYHYVCL